MRKGFAGLTAAWVAITVAAAPGPQAASSQSPSSNSAPGVSSHRTVINQFCVACHNERTRTAGLALETFDLTDISNDAEVWEKVVRRLRAGTMPPQGARRPDAATYQNLTASLETELDRAAAARPHPGRPVLRRLNRTEYANAIRDLLALDVNVASLLPPDDAAYGFDNISDVLGVSPALQERYLSAAEKISGLAVGDPDVAPVSDTYRIRQDLSQNQHIERLPLGTVGGMVIRHNFPLDGEYSLQVKFYRTNFSNLRGLEYPRQVEIAVDGVRVHVATMGGDADLAAAFERPADTADAIDARAGVRVPVRAGPRTITIAFVENFPILDTARLQPFLRSASDTLDWTGRPHIESLTITGPFNPAGPGETPSRQRIFTCRPATRAAEAGCARQIISTLARRAYRQPVSESDLRRVLSFYDLARRDGNFETGIQRALQLILASPRFVFRIERDPAASAKAPASLDEAPRSRANVAPGSVYRVSDVELASRLSFFLWSTIPDDELLEVASHGKLSAPAVLERQVRRMLADPRSRAIVINFGGQWLHLRNVRSLLPNSDQFPDFDDNLRRAFQRETELLFESIMREDRNVLELLTSDYTFVNERLARHYGIANIYGSHFRRVPVTNGARRGLLGHGSMLAVTSHATRTSPVLRGKWILENILGTPPPPPLPDVPALKENEKGSKPRTLRQQMAEHRANPVCATCHKIMDPLGFALENFDAVGAWRTHEAGVPIDASGELADGARVDGVESLRQALVNRPELFVSTMTEKLLTYALGRGLDHHDLPAVRKVVRGAAPGYRFSSLVLGIVNSTPFQMRQATE